MPMQSSCYTIFKYQGRPFKHLLNGLWPHRTQTTYKKRERHVQRHKETQTNRKLITSLFLFLKTLQSFWLLIHRASKTTSGSRPYFRGYIKAWDTLMLQNFHSMQRGTKIEKKMHRDGRDHFSQYLPCGSPRKDPVLQTTKWHSQRVPGTHPFSEGSYEQLELVSIGRWGHPKVGDHSKELGVHSSRLKTGNCQEEQGAEILSLVESKHVLENSVKDCDGSWAQRQSSETPKQAVQRNSGVSLTGNTQDSTWQSPEWPDLRPCFRRRLAQVRSHQT